MPSPNAPFATSTSLSPADMYQSSTRTMFLEAERARTLVDSRHPIVNRSNTGNRKNISSETLKFGGALGFADERDRFKTDAALEERQRLIAERAKKEHRYAFKRNHFADREEARWSQLNERFHLERDREDWKRAHSRKEQSGVGYNPITNMYRAGDKGQALKNEDVAAKNRVAKRSQFLYAMNNSYNPVTGKDIRSDLKNGQLASQGTARTSVDNQRK